MVDQTENHQLDSELTLHDSSQSPLTVRAIALSLTKQDDELIACRLTLQINPQLYHRIDTAALFNLKPDARNSLSSGKFLSEPDITIETSLKPDLLPLLAEHAVNIDETAKYILNLNQEQPDNQILFTESWLGLSVKQQQESGEIGYRTLWSYISPENLSQTSASGEGIAEGIVNFFKDWTEANLSAKTQKSAAKMLEGIDKFLTQFADINTDEITQKIEATLPSDSTDGSLFEAIINFFQADNWPFVQLPGQPALQIPFQGENGTWNCYARARNEQNQFVFYSICPVNAPEN
ncbi:YbjN domain-containing protein, partial [Nostoc cf. edaphicum LEGE 07299]